MREFRTSGSVEGAVGNHRPYSDQRRRQSPAAEERVLARSTASAGGYADPSLKLAAPGGQPNIVYQWHLAGPAPVSWSGYADIGLSGWVSKADSHTQTLAAEFN